MALRREAGAGINPGILYELFSCGDNCDSEQDLTRRRVYKAAQAGPGSRAPDPGARGPMKVVLSGPRL